MSKQVTSLNNHSRRAHYIANTAKLDAMIKPLRSASYEVDVQWTYFLKMLDGYAADYGAVELNPDFQRGHVWTMEQQRHFIENVLRGVVSSSGFLIQFNCPNWDHDIYEGDLPRGFQCIDGLQRLTAVELFLAGEVRPFGLTPDDLSNSAYAIVNRYRFRFAVHNFTRKADLLQHYIDLNAGGTPHSSAEIDRIRTMLNEVDQHFIRGTAPATNLTMKM